MMRSGALSTTVENCAVCARTPSALAGYVVRHHLGVLAKSLQLLARALEHVHTIEPGGVGIGILGRVGVVSEGVPFRTVVTTFVIPAVISVLTFTAAVAFWTDRSVGNEEAFRENAAEVLAMDSSQEALAVRLMDEAVEAVPLLALIRGAGERATLVLLGSGAFDSVFNRLIVEGHRHVVSQTDDPFTADLTDVRTVLVAPIARIAPDLAERVPVDVFEAVVILDSDALPVVGRVAGWLPVVSVITAAAAVFFAVALVMLSRRRSVALVTVGLAVLIAGISVYAWSTFGGSIATARISDELTRVLVTNGYAVFTRSLQTEGLVLVVAGSVIAATGFIGVVAGLARREA